MFNKNLALNEAKTRSSFYMYEQAQILENIEKLKTAFPKVGFLYSLKCNPNPKVLDTIFAEGIGGDAASLAEVMMSIERNVPMKEIQYSAPAKSMSDIENAIKVSTINADSVSEVERIAEIAAKNEMVAEIGVRINPNFTFNGEGIVSSKFGVDQDVFFEMLPIWAKMPNIKIVGIHVHSKSQELDYMKIYSYYERMFKLAMATQTALGYDLEFMNMGSGIGVNYAENDAAVDVATLGEKLMDLMAAYETMLPSMKVYIETGRYLVCKAGTYVTTVLDKKVSAGKTYVLLANTLNGFIRPSITRLVATYTDEPKVNSEPLFTSLDAFTYLPLVETAETETVNLVGNLCTAIDIIAANINVPVLNVGDALAINNAGAYAAVLSPMQFSTQVKPAELFISVDGEVFEY